MSSVAIAQYPLQAKHNLNKRERAKAVFENAEKGRTALEGKPASARKLPEYERLITNYRRVYVLSPASPYVDDALLAIAELYQQMGNDFRHPSYFRRAIEAYEFLMKEYPYSKFHKEALFTIGVIYQNDLNDKEKALLTFEKYVEKYKQGPKVVAAKENIAQLKRKTDVNEKPGKSASSPKETAVATTNEASGETPSFRLDDPTRLPRVTNIRHWSTSNYTRVVIDMDGEVQFDQSRISDPDRLFFDLKGAKLSSLLLGKSFPVESGFLKEIRAGQFQPNVVRIVLDLDKIQDYTVFPLYNPYRLVVDVRGVETVAEKISPPEKPAAPPIKSIPPETEMGKEVSGRETGESAKESEVSSKETPQKSPRGALGEPISKPPTRKPSSDGKAAPAETKAAITPHTAKPNSAGSMGLIRSFGLKIGKIVIDPGHGGHDYGTIGPTGLAEKDLVLDVSLRLGKLLEEKLGSQVIYTRDDDTFIPLENRTALANQKQADLFLSVHANSSRNRNASGVETFFLGLASRTDQETLEIVARENAFSERSLHDLQDVIKKITLNEKVDESRELAANVQKTLIAQTAQWNQRTRNRGVKRAHFIVLIGANMPSILTEISFLSNPSDERLLKKPENRQKLAQSIYNGILNYVSTLSGVKVAKKMETEQ